MNSRRKIDPSSGQHWGDLGPCTEFGKGREKNTYRKRARDADSDSARAVNYARPKYVTDAASRWGHGLKSARFMPRPHSAVTLGAKLGLVNPKIGELRPTFRPCLAELARFGPELDKFGQIWPRFDRRNRRRERISTAKSCLSTPDLCRRSPEGENADLAIVPICCCTSRNSPSCRFSRSDVFGHCGKLATRLRHNIWVVSCACVSVSTGLSLSLSMCSREKVGRQGVVDKKARELH